MKRLLLPTLITMAFLPVAQAAEYQAQRNSERPNIVLVISEDMSSRIGAFGDPIAHTPNLDALAKEGVRFNQVYTMAGVSAPSRAGLITGAPSHISGLQHMRTADQNYVGVPPSYIKAYPELLRRSGYYTYNDIKTDYQFVKGAMDPGPFTIWSAHGSPKQFSDYLVPSAWRHADLQDKPFFLNLNPMITHESGLFTAGRAPEKFKGLQQLMEKIRAQYPLTTPDIGKIKLPDYLVDSTETRQEVARFYQNIAVMDQQVGKVISDLKQDGLWDNTIFIFTTDHGDCLPRSKREGYITGTHVPMIMHIPDRFKPKWMPANGKSVDRLISFEDMAPTLLGFAGVKPLFYMNGIDLSQDQPRARKYVYADRGRMDNAPLRSYYVADTRYQYVRNFDHTPNGASIDFRNYLASVEDLNQGHAKGTLNAKQKIWFEPKPDEQLYDLKVDPLELNNLAADPAYQQKLIEMRHAMSEWRNRANDMGVVDEQVMKRDLLNSDGTQKTTLPPVPERDVTTGEVFIANRTSGASIGYSYDGKVWQVYNGSFVPPHDTHQLQVKAVRYGWKESETTNYSW